MTGTIEVEHDRGDQFRIAVRDHHVVVDQPTADSPGAGPTPTEYGRSARPTRRSVALHGAQQPATDTDVTIDLARHRQLRPRPR